MRFEFATASRIMFGAGVAKDAASAVTAFGRRPLVVTGRSQDRADRLGVEGPRFSVPNEPTIDLIREAIALGRAEHCDAVVAVGGGSALDAGKAIAALIANEGDALRYLEVVGEGKPLEKPSLPCIAIPTTSGTGSEVTRNAVLASLAHKVKASLRHASMLPRLAIVDPELTLGLPRAVTAATGLDAFTQLLEPYVSIRSNPMTDALCIDGLQRAARALPRAWLDGNDIEARAEMSLASLYGGMALANSGLGAVHGFAAPIGGMFDAPHGAVCAALLPAAIAINRRALQEREPLNPSLRKYATVDALLNEPVEQFASRLCLQLEVPNLRAYGISEADVDDVCNKASNASSMKANPITLTRGELRELLRMSL